jgi:5-(carboxyamino)imidazole ribonucleotide synthase
VRIGIIGGGQLGRMFALAGYPLGLHFAFYDPDTNCCSKELAPTTHAEFNDIDSLIQFVKNVDVVTYENENIPIETLKLLNEHKPIRPTIEAIRLLQDRWLEKNFIQDLNIPTAEFLLVETVAAAKVAAEKLQFPFILKSRRFGYDGKGQIRLTKPADLNQLSDTLLAPGYIAEKHIHFQREFSIIGVKGLTGEIAFYDLCENIHKNGILSRTVNKIDDPLFDRAKAHVTTIIDKLGYVGTIAVEFFDVDHEPMINEIAPRVHNSGHWTIEGAYTSQFENHLRAIIGMPLGDTNSRCEIEMHNIIGEMPERATILKANKSFLHDYGKSPRPGRKLGHITTIISP